MLEIIILALSISIAVVTAIWSALSIVKLFRLKKLFDKSTVVVPLYKRSKWTYFSLGFLGACLIADIVMVIVLKAYVVCSCVMVIILALGALLVFMMKLKCGVLDSGIVIPYKFIDWTHLYDFVIVDNTIFFCGDKKGFDTMTSASTRLTFDENNKEKLEYILSQYKLNN